MGFFDTYDDSYSGAFIKGNEKAELIDDRTTLKIVGVRLVPNGAYNKEDDQYVLSVELDDEPRSLGFTRGTVESRDRMLDAMIEHFKQEDAEPVYVFLEKVKQSVLIRNAETVKAE
jgi:hypothetical protein